MPRGTVDFPGTAIDESENAARIARHLGMEHILLPLEPVAAGDLLPAVQAAFDEPCAATAAVPIWHLSRLAVEHVKVVLCGEGADEIFAGYKRQRNALAAARMRPLLRALGPVLSAVEMLPEGPARFNYLRQNARRFADSAQLGSSFQQFFAATQITPPHIRARLYEPRFRLAQDPADAFARLEARVPFLGHKFVEWSLTMPRELKLRGKLGKYALRKAVEPWLFPGALHPRKLGFQLPFAEWFRGDFADFAHEAWSGSGAAQAGYLQPQAVEALFAEHRAGRANHGRVLYAVAMFAIWWEQTFAAQPAARQPVIAC